MTMQDPLADMLTRIRNAQLARLAKCPSPHPGQRQLLRGFCGTKDLWMILSSQRETPVSPR